MAVIEKNAADRESAQSIEFRNVCGEAQSIGHKLIDDTAKNRSLRKCRSTSDLSVYLGRLGDIRVAVLDQIAIVFVNLASPQLQCGSKRAVADAQLLRQYQDLLQLLELGEIIVHVLHDTLVESLHPRIARKLCVGGVSDVVLGGPVAQHRHGWRNHHAREPAPLTDNGGLADQRVRLQGIFDRLWRDEFSAGGLDQILLAIGDDKESVRIDGSHIASLEPITLESILRLLRHIPVAGEDRRSLHEYFSVLGDLEVHVRKDSSYRTEFVCRRIIQGDYRRCLSQAVAFVNSDSYHCIPLAELSAQGRAAGDEGLYASTHASRYLREHQLVGESPLQRLGRLSCKDGGRVVAADANCPVE